MPEHLVDHGVLRMSYHCRHRPFRWSAPIEIKGGLPFKLRPVLLPARCTEILGIADSKERQVRATTTAGPHHFATFREQARRISCSSGNSECLPIHLPGTSANQNQEQNHFTLG